MSHAKSLRVIGQALEAAQIATFELEKYSPQYMIWTVSVSEAGQRILRNALRHDKVTPQEVRARANHVFCFSPADILRLDAQAQKQRRNQSFSDIPPSKLLSHGLRTLGDHFDRTQVNAFRIEWTVGAIILDYQRMSGQRHCRTLSAEELQHMCEQPKLRRASPYLFPKLDM